MTRYVALLRAVNVGGTGKLPMAELRAMCEAAGFKQVQTYIASGNVVFDSDADEAVVKATLERTLLGYAGKPVGVIVRTGPEMAAVVTANPFQSAAPNRVIAVFLDSRPPADWRDSIKGSAMEEVAEGNREIYVHYPLGQANTKLRMNAFATGTGRNMNSVAKLAEIAG